MNRITRYILIELLKVFIVTLTGMTALMIVVVVAQEAIRQGLGPSAVARVVPYVLPSALLFAVPGTILFAACSVYGRMSASNEVVAIKSLGVSPMTIVWPALVLAFLLSLVTVWLNDMAVSWGRNGVDRVVIHSVEEVAYGMLRTHRSYRTNRFSINVKRVDGRKLILPTLVVYAKGDEAPMTLQAKEAELRSDFENDMLIVVLRNGFVEVRDEVTLRFFDTFEHHVPLLEASKKGRTDESPSNYSLREIPAEKRRQRDNIKRIEQGLAVQAAYQVIGGDFDSLTSTSWNNEQGQLTRARERLFRLETEPWRRWANGFSCFFFVLVGAPLAIRLRNSDIWTSFALCFLPILIIYYPQLALGVDRAKNGALPPYSVWMGNVVLLLVGLLLLRHVQRS